MIKKALLLSVFFTFTVVFCDAQTFIRTADLFKSQSTNSRSGTLNIFQPEGVDTLISRYILANRLLDGNMEGFRIQVFRSSKRNAREESNKVRAEFMIDFPDIPSYAKYEKPGYFLIRAGDYRTKVEGTKQLFLVRKKFPNAYLVPDIINFPDLIKN
jgi:hypothetical protein